MIRTRMMGTCLGLLLVVAGACHATKPTSSTGGGGAGGSGGAAYGDGLCGKCAAHACVSAHAACDDEPKCVAYLACLNACPPTTPDGDADPACASACPGTPGGSAQVAIDAYTACRTTGLGANCATCGIAGGGDAGLTDWGWILHPQCPDSTDPDPCHRCEQQYCCTTLATLKADPAAEAYLHCLQNCTGPGDCFEICAEQTPDGVKNLAPLLACDAQFCSDADACGDKPLDPCLVCANQNCALPKVNFYAEAEGLLLGSCLATCAASNGSCWNACFAKYPDAVPLFQAYKDCLDAAHCGTQCL
jgi:hypothetical protein